MTAARSQHKLANAPAGGFMETLKSAPVVATAVGSLLPLAAKGIEAGWDAFQAHRQHAQGFKAMLDMHPHLRQEKSEQVSRVYNSVYRASPHAATDPFVAGSIVTQIVQGSNHIDPSEGGRAFLVEYDRLVSQRGNMGRGQGGQESWSKMVAQGGQQMAQAIGQEHGAMAQLRNERARQSNKDQVHDRDESLRKIQDTHKRMTEEQRLHASAMDMASDRLERAQGAEAKRDPSLGRMMSAMDRYTAPGRP